MNISNIPGLLLAGVAGMPTAQAGINPGTTDGILGGREKCASALNSYLRYRHAHITGDAYRTRKLEEQVDSLCEGYQVRLVENNGVLTGVIELAD